MKVFWLTLSLFIAILPKVGSAEFPDSQTVSAAERDQENVLRYLRPALKSVRGVARINYETHCAGEDEKPVHFVALPLLKAQDAPADSRGLPAVREVFKNDKRVSVSQEISGIINITVGNPPTEILKTKIPVVRFDPGQQYNPVEALGGILSAPEVRAAMEKWHFEVPLITANIRANPPTKGLPHLPPELRNVTIEDALDVIAKTFHGIVTYGVCTLSGDRHNFWFNFIKGER